MEDKRKSERHHLVHYLRIFERTTGGEIGNLLNVTVEGICMLRFEPLRIRTPLKMRMDFPEEFEDKTEMEFNGRVVWCRFNSEYDMYAIGFRIYDITDVEKQLFQHLIDFYKDTPDIFKKSGDADKEIYLE